MASWRTDSRRSFGVGASGVVFALVLDAGEDPENHGKGNRRRQAIRVPRSGRGDRPFRGGLQAREGCLWGSVQRKPEAVGLSGCCEENIEGVQRRSQGLFRRSEHNQRSQTQESSQVFWLVLPGTQPEHSPFHVQLLVEEEEHGALPCLRISG